jgi:plasmid stability protein
MTSVAKRSTLYLDPDLHKALKVKAVETDRSMSDLVNEALKNSLAEDSEDLAAFEIRLSEPLVSYEDMLKELKKNDRI